MARKLGPDADTRAALLRAAGELIVSQGYDATSVNAVIARAGLSKGTFYHWFDSKQALLETLVDALSMRGLAFLEARLAEPAASALELLDRFYLQGRAFRKTHGGQVHTLGQALYRPENVAVMRALERRSLARTAPVLAGILERGRGEGVFVLDDPLLTAQTLLVMGSAVAQVNFRMVFEDPDDPGVPQVVAERVNLSLTLLERMLGAPAGGLTRVDAQTIRAVLGAGAGGVS